MGARQDRMRDGRAVQGLHDPLGEEEIPEKTGDEQVLAKELLKEIAVEHVPGDRVCNGREDPIKLALHGAAVVYLARDLLEHVQRETGHKLAQLLVGHVPVDGGLDGRGQTGGEYVHGQLGVAGQRLVEATGAQVNRVANARACSAAAADGRLRRRR